jgi:CRP/FNR family transcriptional regulator, anaerobic regulatory protein
MDATILLDKLKTTLLSKAMLSPDELAMALDMCKMQHLKKGELLTQIGEIENKVVFIVDGVTRSFFYKNEKEISLDFHFSGDFVNVYESFIDQVPAGHAIEALTDLLLMVMSHHDLQTLYATKPKFELVGRVLVEEQFKKSSERVKNLLSLSATEYYYKLLTAQPKLINNIPLKHLASYLNVTPESLSRVRKSISLG